MVLDGVGGWVIEGISYFMGVWGLQLEAGVGVLGNVRVSTDGGVCWGCG